MGVGGCDCMGCGGVIAWVRKGVWGWDRLDSCKCMCVCGRECVQTSQPGRNGRREMHNAH